MRNGSFWGSFLRENDIRYIIDHEYIVDMYWNLFGRGSKGAVLRPVVIIDIPYLFSEGKSARIIVYEVKDSGDGVGSDGQRAAASPASP